MKRSPSFLALALAVLLPVLFSACARPQAEVPPPNLTVTNDSGAEVYAVSVFYEYGSGAGAETCVGQNADNSPLAKGDSLSFECPERDSLSVRVSVYGGLGQTPGAPLAEGDFTLDLAEGKAAFLAIRERADGRLQIGPPDAPA